MKLIRKHLIGIICFIIAILYVLIIALNIKETKKENKEDLSKYKVLCTEILKQEDTDEEKKEWCTEILNTEYEIEETLKKVNLFEEKDKKYSKYSLGIKQKLGIAQVLMENPEIIILDEPFNAIEEETVNKIKNILLEEKSKGKLIILSSHIKDDILLFFNDSLRIKLIIKDLLLNIVISLLLISYLNIKLNNNKLNCVFLISLIILLIFYFLTNKLIKLDLIYYIVTPLILIVLKELSLRYESQKD